MTSLQILEVAAAAVLLGLGIWLYRRPSPEPDNYGSQGAVLLFVVAVLLAVHGLGLMEYRPSPSEIEAAR